MTRKRALITGITGMVGSHLAEYLLANTDWDVYGLCRWRSPLDNIEAIIPRANNKDRVVLMCGDLRDTMSIHEVAANRSRIMCFIWLRKASREPVSTRRSIRL